MNSPDIIQKAFADMMDQKDGSYSYSDLELAAEIGKTLLERNRELEILLKSTQQYAEEMSMKNEFLGKQLDNCRESNEKRVKTNEQLENTVQELQHAYTKLQKENKSLQKRNIVLLDNLESLESKQEELKTENEDLRGKTTRLEKELEDKDRKEEMFVANEVADRCPSPAISQREEIIILEKEVQYLSETIKNLKSHHRMEKMKRDELEYEMADMVHENAHLQSQIKDLSEQAEKWKDISEKIEEWRELVHRYGAKDYEQFMRSRDDHVNVETDDEADVTPARKLEIKSHSMPDVSRFSEATDFVRMSSYSSQENMARSGEELSFLSELDHQYRELLDKYDTLLEKCRADSKNVNTVQRAVQTAIDTTPPPSPTPREYRLLFAEIFAKLQDFKHGHKE